MVINDDTPSDPTPTTPTLAAGRVLVVGVGGLGAPAAMQLAAVGVGTLGLMDGDRVELSNLQRQIVYRSDDLGRPKASAAAERLAALHPRTTVLARDARLTASNLPQIFPDFDFVIDSTDNVESKFLVNDGAVAHRIPYAHAGVIGFRGQTFTIIPHRSACLRCIFPSLPEDRDLPTCETAGILGAVAGAIGLMQAAEAIKYLLRVGDLLTNRLLTYDGWGQTWRDVAIQPNPRCPACGSGTNHGVA